LGRRKILKKGSSGVFILRASKTHNEATTQYHDCKQLAKFNAIILWFKRAEWFSSIHLLVYYVYTLNTLLMLVLLAML